MSTNGIFGTPSPCFKYNLLWRKSQALYCKKVRAKYGLRRVAVSQHKRGCLNKAALYLLFLFRTAEEIRMQNRRTYPGASRIRIRQVPDFGGRDVNVPVCAYSPSAKKEEAQCVPLLYLFSAHNFSLPLRRRRYGCRTVEPIRAPAVYTYGKSRISAGGT